MPFCSAFCSAPLVALLAEGVDRNENPEPFEEKQGEVALLAEGVDRNRARVFLGVVQVGVALLAEGVDRNCFAEGYPRATAGVALLAEGVDRNAMLLTARCSRSMSPSSRRAWIEIQWLLASI